MQLIVCIWLFELLSQTLDYAYLYVEQVELNWVPGVYILVRVEELSPEEQHFSLLYPLLTQRPPVVQPIY